MDAHATTEAAGGTGILGWLMFFWTSNRSFKKNVYERFDYMQERMDTKLEEVRDELATHALYDAENMVKPEAIASLRTEINVLRDHIDNKLDNIHQTLLLMAQNGK